MFILNLKLTTGVLRLFLGLTLVTSFLQAQAQAQEIVYEDEVYEEEVYDDEGTTYQDETHEDNGVVYEEDYEEEFYEEPVPVQPAPAPVQPAPTQIRPTRPAPPSARVPTPTRGTQPSMQTNGTMGMGSPNLEKSGATPEDYISFDFDDTPLFEVIRTIARLTGRNYDVDPNIGATTVTLITHDMIPPELAYQVLEAILARRGFSMVENVEGHIIEIIPTPDAPTSAKTDLVDGLEYIPEGFDVYSTHIVPVRYADASELANALRLVASGAARIDTYAPTNTLIITDTADGLRRMFRLLEAIDSPGTETEMDIFILEYTRASIIAEQLQQVLLDEGTARTPQAQQARPQAQPQPQPTRATRPVRPTIPGTQQMQVIGSREEVLRIMSDERLNSLIVVASSGMMIKVRDLVRRLDIPTNYEQNTMHIYQLLNADAEQVEQALAPFLGGSGRLQTTGGGGQGGAGGQQATSDVQPFEQQVQISRYDQTNSLLINASPQDFKLLEAFIARLDVPKRQVQVSAVVMDVTISDSFGLTFDAASITGHDGFAVANTRNIAELAQAAQAAQEIVGGPAAALGSAILGLGSDGGITAGMYDDITLNINGQDVKIPFVPLLFQAIETISELEVLSQPTLVSIDNEEASYVVGQEVPFITATSRPSTTTDGQISSQYGTTRVEREEVGVKLMVTPQISEGDNVLLNLEIEVSDLDTDQIGTVDILGPTTNKSLIRNKILVKDGSTAVIAGLIRDSTSRSRNQAPILGDVPILGNLFRRRSSSRLKRNMVVLVTPHIVKEGGDMDRLTQNMVHDYYDANVDELFRRGFFQKVQRKQEMRKNFRPTLEQSEALTGRRTAESFGRGDIQK